MMTPDDMGLQPVAEAFGVEPELVHLLPDLLAQLWVLGSWPERIVRLLSDLATLTKDTRVLDLGCGKGAVAIPIAQQLGFRVRGIDLFPPFVQEARKRAQSCGVAELCSFELGDLRQAVREQKGYDVTVLAAVGAALFGNHARCVGQLRQTVREGGYLIIDDGYLQREVESRPPGYEYYRCHEATIGELTAHGDALVQEVLVPRHELEACNRRCTRLIRQQASRLMELHPESAEPLARFIESEVAECGFLETETMAAIWLLQRC